MTANVSSSSAPARPEPLGVDVLAHGRQQLGGLPASLLRGGDADLLAPLRFLAPGSLPTPVSAHASTERRDLARALAATNRSYGHPEADRLGEKLADPATQVVITGQQPGLLGGPLYSLTKLLATARYAAALEAEGIPAVPLFWVATEDHDFAEVAKVSVLGGAGPVSFDLGADEEPLRPVGMRTLGPGIVPLLAAVAQAGSGPGYAAWIESLSAWFRPEARFGEAFSRLMVRLAGVRCPLLIDAMHPALKSAQRPSLSRLIRERHQVSEALAAREAALVARGFEPKVSPQTQASPLFLLHRGARRRIEWRDDDRYVLRGGREQDGGTASELERIVADNPSVVSPGALARPGVQDAVFGTCLQVLGPGELSYMAQSASLYPTLEITSPPWVALRPQILVLDDKQRERLANTGLPLSSLLGEQGALEHEVAQRTGADFVAPVRVRLEAELDAMRGPALAVDANLERPFDKTREQVVRALELFDQKVASAAAQRDKVLAQRIAQLRDASLPADMLQERFVSTSHFPGKYGDSFVEAIWDQLSLDPRELQVITP
jgi:bacillithiol biosynthesis cysteine-adding enzyme BshC